MLHILIVDDESLARQRLRFLLQSLADPPCTVQEVGSAAAAEALLQRAADGAAPPVDVVLLDIQMPGLNGVDWAHTLRQKKGAPVVVFVTAHAEYAAQAFDLEAADYLTKPVRLERLRQALRRAAQQRAIQGGGHGQAGPAVAEAAHLVIHERHRTLRVPLEEVLLCRADQKYVTAVTPTHQYLLADSLNELERRYPECFLRVHRNALVARTAMRGLVRASSAQDGEQWCVTLNGSDEAVPVSRRMVASVRAALKLSGV